MLYLIEILRVVKSVLFVLLASQRVNVNVVITFHSFRWERPSPRLHISSYYVKVIRRDIVM